MNNHFAQEWNNNVANEDIIIVVGDMSAGLKDRRDEYADFLKKLSGKKILIRGNHDHEPDDFYLQNGFHLVREHLHVAGVLFHHFPPSDDRKDDKSLSYGTRCALRYIETYKPWAFLHGHDHRVDVPERQGCFNCASDRNNHTPVDLFKALRSIDECRTQEHFKYVKNRLFELVV
jgi:calcineurin-like phosphoesterase family protein